MSVIRFRAMLKGDLPHYSFIFRKTEPLGAEFKKSECSRLGVMFYVEIKRGRGPHWVFNRI